MMGLSTQATLVLPNWVPDFVSDYIELEGGLTTPEARMRLAVALSRENTTHKTGGPFGSIIVDDDSGEIVSVGVNLVVSGNCSVAHGEAVAIILAQQGLGTFDLRAGHLSEKRYVLYTSAQPCIQCFGMTFWSGLRGLAYSASAQDTEEILGFNEGPIPTDWREQLENIGCPVISGLIEEEGRESLLHYVRSGGFVYSPGSSV